MPSIPLTPDEERHCLRVLGVQNVEDLFASVPPKIRENADFKLDLGWTSEGNTRGLTEHELRTYFGNLAAKNAVAPLTQHFLGGGYYDNVIPAIVNQLVLRGEFLTCYTPYQPEISQGTLQAIFEFQTMICRLTAMEVANASMYDGATATAEAVLMAQRLAPRNRQKVLVASSVHPIYREVVDTFLQSHTDRPVLVPWNDTGALDTDALRKLLAEHKPCAVVVGQPNYFGIIEPLDLIKEVIPKDCLFIVTMPDPSALSIFEPPGNFGADIVVGEAHQLGTPLLYGGPHVGFFATKKSFLRQMPGRLCGETVDVHGKCAYTLTLSTREQHIRREKATSNICTNQGLIALRTTIYLSFLGKLGFKNLGLMNYSLFDYLTHELDKVGIPLRFKQGLHYREGIFRVPNLKRRMENAYTKHLIPGIPMDRYFHGTGQDFTDSLLICVHPKHTMAQINQLVETLSRD